MSNEFTPAVGENKKFKPDGSFQWYPGNTIVCNLYGNQMVFDEVRWLQSQYTNLSCSHKFVCVPPESVHMTVFELLCHHNRKPQYWSSHVDLDAPIDEIDRFFATVLENIEFPSKFLMRIIDVGTKSILLAPADQATSSALMEFREQVSRATGIRFPNHDTYQYHITFGYQILHLTPEEEAEVSKWRQDLYVELCKRLTTIEMERIHYTVFEDMTNFVPYTSTARRLLKGSEKRVT
jgi:hypothetical protein